MIRNNPLVAKVVNGKRVAFKPARDFNLYDLAKAVGPPS
jgi:hypothetical protein